MKRYWKILTLCLITVIVLGTFYIQSSLALENIRFEFEKVSGDESLVENLEINADYVVGDNHQTLLISNEETSNLSNRSVVQQLTGLYGEASAEQLISKYKSFMRGKNLLSSNFYEDEQVVVYASIEGKSINASSLNSFFDIDVLDKKSEKSTSMKLDLPKTGSYGWVDIVDIQIKEGKLLVIARGSRINGGEDLVAYTIDLNGKKITNEEVVFSTPTVENGWSDFRFLNDYHSNGPEKYLLFKAEAFEHESSEGPTAIVDDFIVYDVENNKIVKMELPEDFVGNIENSSVVDSVVYIPVQTPNEIKVIQYEIETEKWDKKQIFGVEPSGNSEGEPFIKLQDGKIYIVRSVNDGHTLAIGDLNTGETLYEGHLKVKNLKTDLEDYKLYIFEIKDVG
ncbi:hypothetical protein E1I69_21060 [Bacillus timonensis]|uniref:Uncharacterized protein n=1 Tax=Bacillus timonensis TaxID=1033734 RepID=A0A4S3PK75_9BACI|nr:hypothetical protein [Bacillus timonensis]THE09789.1 hypothetical protein E1I69_21060 [Bacillus timonensis]